MKEALVAACLLITLLTHPALAAPTKATPLPPARQFAKREDVRLHKSELCESPNAVSQPLFCPESITVYPLLHADHKDTELPKFYTYRPGEG